MGKKMSKKILSAMILTLMLFFSQDLTASAKETVGNGIILSTDIINLNENSAQILVAAMQEGADASKLACISSNPYVATVTPVISVNNVANFQINYIGSGLAVVAIYHIDNPSIVAYTTVNASPVTMNIPNKLGTNKSNYCSVINYEFVPYDFNKYMNFGDYEYTLKLNYRCDSYKDDAYAKWGCFGYFYDASGNVLSKVHLYCSSLSEGRIYKSEFNVPVNAVRFSVEGF